MSKYIPEFYQPILEAAERGELWGTCREQNHSIQLELEFNSCLNS
tara:strand:- start:6 stop:140 length:135 start_codon:yes stop_codon:yes gene_type:complete